jgi:hypothetical protein
VRCSPAACCRAASFTDSREPFSCYARRSGMAWGRNRRSGAARADSAPAQDSSRACAADPLRTGRSSRANIAHLSVSNIKEARRAFNRSTWILGDFGGKTCGDQRFLWKPVEKPAAPVLLGGKMRLEAGGRDADGLLLLRLSFGFFHILGLGQPFEFHLPRMAGGGALVRAGVEFGQRSS